MVWRDNNSFFAPIRDLFAHSARSKRSSHLPYAEPGDARVTAEDVDGALYMPQRTTVVTLGCFRDCERAAMKLLASERVERLL